MLTVNPPGEEPCGVGRPMDGVELLIVDENDAGCTDGNPGRRELVRALERALLSRRNVA